MRTLRERVPRITLKVKEVRFGYLVEAIAALYGCSVRVGKSGKLIIVPNMRRSFVVEAPDHEALVLDEIHKMGELVMDNKEYDEHEAGVYSWLYANVG